MPMETQMKTIMHLSSPGGNGNETETETFKDLTFSFPPSEKHILPLRKRK